MTTSWRPVGRGPVPEPDPARHQAAAALRAALEDVSPPGDEFSLHLAAAVALLRSGVLAAPGLAPRPASVRPGSLRTRPAPPGAPPDLS